MGTVTHRRAKVLPGNIIEVPVLEFTVGETVDVTVSGLSSERKPGRSILEVIDALPGGRLLKTPEDVTRYLEEERASWDF